MEVTIWSYASLSNQNMNVRVEIDAISEGLDDRNDSGHQIKVSIKLEVLQEGLNCSQTERGKKRSLEKEENPQHLGHGKDDLVVRDEHGSLFRNVN